MMISNSPAPPVWIRLDRPKKPITAAAMARFRRAGSSRRARRSHNAATCHTPASRLHRPIALHTPTCSRPIGRSAPSGRRMRPGCAPYRPNAARRPGSGSSRSRRSSRPGASAQSPTGRRSGRTAHRRPSADRLPQGQPGQSRPVAFLDQRPHIHGRDRCVGPMRQCAAPLAAPLAALWPRLGLPVGEPVVGPPGCDEVFMISLPSARCAVHSYINTQPDRCALRAAPFLTQF